MSVHLSELVSLRRAALSSLPACPSFCERGERLLSSHSEPAYLSPNGVSRVRSRASCFVSCESSLSVRRSISFPRTKLVCRRGKFRRLFGGPRAVWKLLKLLELVCGSVRLRTTVPSPPKFSYLVDPASSHMLVSKIKPCMSKYKPH